MRRSPNQQAKDKAAKIKQLRWKLLKIKLEKDKAVKQERDWTQLNIQKQRQDIIEEKESFQEQAAYYEQLKHFHQSLKFGPGILNIQKNALISRNFLQIKF
jgi:hypothetical protein